MNRPKYSKHFAPIGIWALRAGCLLAADWLAREHAVSPPLVFWQPVNNGEQHLTQFLRLKAISEMLGAAEGRGVVSKLIQEISSDIAIEVAGYRLAPGLAKGIMRARLQLPDHYPGRISILEVAHAAREVPSPKISTLLREWTDAGVNASARVVRGTSFWQTQEIETAPELIPASLQVLAGIAT